MLSYSKIVLFWFVDMFDKIILRRFCRREKNECIDLSLIHI